VVLLSPYKLISGNELRVKAALYLDPPTNAFSGLFCALSGRHRDIYLCAVAVTSIISEFLPALLNNVPYRVVETHLVHMVCTWISVVVLCIMIIVVVGSFFVNWPHMPMDPATVAGAMYYVVVPGALPDAVASETA
jgi:hypothetical protein